MTTRFSPDFIHSALIVVDVQPDFMPGGALACEDGDQIVSAIDALLAARRFGHVVATQDWHPAGHVSFASQHPGRAPFERIPLHGEEQTLWPDHCVQGSPGAQLHPMIDWAPVDLIIRKGTDPQVDSYSAFRHNPGPAGSRPTTGLAGWLRERGVTDVYLCGLARDVCVLWSAEDAVDAGFKTHLLWSLTRPVSSANDTATRQALANGRVEIGEIDSAN
ncbi:bifunctional nicotinamidase/pyrazinamidase [Halotalea alkalilenta]|uniref:bifunctional nicotinamidase/pyrazinamidase n=1 Tax=Halotalea alkalilenta TaxID=376489 RepID=UPI000483B45A|nr:bifunctional nicotinamidase/pyrazinamidase [Halotalea alkalilenta]